MTSKRFLPLLGIFAGGLLLLGCPSTTMQAARTLGKGKFEIAAELGGLHDRGSLDRGPWAWGGLANVSARGGITDRIDLGGRLGSSGVELQSKFLLTDPAARVFHLSLAPSIGFLGIGVGELRDGGYLLPPPLFHANLPLLIGFETGGGSEVVLGPRIVYGVNLSNASSQSVLFAGGTVGYRIHITRVFRIHPEVGILKPVLRATPHPVFQFGLGLAFGNGF